MTSCRKYICVMVRHLVPINWRRAALRQYPVWAVLDDLCAGRCPPWWGNPIMSSITMNITMVIANSAASAPEMMMGNSHSHAYKGKYQGKIIDCVPSERPFITTSNVSKNINTHTNNKQTISRYTEYKMYPIMLLFQLLFQHQILQLVKL